MSRLTRAAGERAVALAKVLLAVQRCFGSPELRTMQTAEALWARRCVAVVLRDRDYGAWRGRAYDDVVERDPDVVAGNGCAIPPAP